MHIQQHATRTSFSNLQVATVRRMSSVAGTRLLFSLLSSTPQNGPTHITTLCLFAFVGDKIVALHGKANDNLSIFLIVIAIEFPGFFEFAAIESNMGAETVIEVILAIFFPPIGVFLRYGCGVRNNPFSFLFFFLDLFEFHWKHNF